MPLEIICGRAKSGKTKYIYNRISQLKKSGGEVMLVVPEQFTHSTEKKLLELIGTMGDSGVEVLSFANLAKKTESILGYSRAQKINSVAKALVFKKVLSENEFEFYKNAGEKQGFNDVALSTVEEFKRYNLTPDELKEIAKQSEDKILKFKLNDVALAFEKYEDSIKEIYSDSDDSLSILAKRLEENKIYENKHVFFDGFDSFVPQEIAVIAGLCKNSIDVTMTLCLDMEEKNTTLFMPTADTGKKLERAIKDTKYKKIDGSYFNSAEISHLQKHLFSFEEKPYIKKAEDIEISALLNPLCEVENCARKINALVRQKGYMYKDIGVVCPDMDMYKRHIERVFDFVGIKYFTDHKSDVIHHHLIRFVLGLLETYIDDYSYNSIFNYLKAIFVDAEPKNIALLERFIQKTGIKRSSWLDDEKWNRLVDANLNDDFSKNSINQIRQNYILPLAKMHEKIKGRNTVKHDAEVLYEYMLNLKMPETILNYIKKFEEEGQLRLSMEYEKLWNITVDTFDEVVFISGERKVSPKALYELLITAFSKQKIAVIPPAVDGVFVGNVERSRFDGIKALFVLGVNETIFPTAPNSDTILSDEEKESIMQKGYELSVTSSVAAYYSQYLTYRTLTTPTDKLYISYSKCGNDFKSLRKSYVVDRITRLFSIKESSELNFDDVNSIYSTENSKELLCMNMRAYSDGKNVGAHWRNLYDYFKNQGDFGETADRFSKSDNLAHKISSENLKKLIPLLSHTSVSKLERYMACSYAYFIDYILRIEKPKNEVVDAIDIGNITHIVLENLSKEFGTDIDTLKKCKTEDVIYRIDEYISKFLDDFCATKDEMSFRDIYTIKRLKNSILLCFEAVRRQLVDSGFVPLGYEIEFGENSSLGAIEIETKKGDKLYLTGKIDRADISDTKGEQYVRVIDYKTGKKELKLDDIFYGLNVQLMVYLSKLVESNDNYRHGGALYFNVGDVSAKMQSRISDSEAKENIESALSLKGLIPCDEDVLAMYGGKIGDSARKSGSSKKKVSVHDFETIDKFLKEKISDICFEMLEGNFEVSPYKKNNFSPCSYCEYSSICRFEPLSAKNDYNFYRSISDSSEIIKKMEEKLNVDTKSNRCD